MGKYRHKKGNGGNAHDRARARAVGSLPDANEVVIQQPDLLLPSKSKTAKPNLDRFIGILSLLFAALLFILQANGVEMNWQRSVVAYLLVAGGCIWSCLRHAVPHLGPKGRYLCAFAVFAVIAVFGTIGTMKQYGREHQKIPVTPSTQKAKKDEPGSQPTLHSLFANTDFPTAMRYTDNATALQFPDKMRLPVISQLYLDFPEKVRFVGFYVPSSPRTFEACMSLPKVVKNVLNILTENKTLIAGGIGDELRRSDELSFSGLVLIYHEDYLSITQRADIVRIFKGAGFDVSFRGPDYLREAINEWHHKNDPKQ